VSRPPRILVVDDEPKNVRLLEAHLVPQGYEVVTAAAGDEALRRLGAQGADLVLLDVMMPGLDGFEVTRRLRADPRTRLIPVVLVTALRETEDRIKGIEAGCDDFISKPFEKDEVLARVKTSLRIGYYRSLLDEKERFDYVIDHIDDGILVLDARLRVTRANPRAGLLLGFDPASPPADLVAHLRQRFAVRPDGDLARAIQAGPLAAELERPETEAASALILSLRSSLVRDPLGALSSVVVLVRDVTEERKEEWLKQNFLDLISHKLRTPVAVIASDAALLTDGVLGPLSDRQRGMAAMIGEKAALLGDLIERLLQFVAVSAQAFDPSAAPAAPADALRSLLGQWAQEPRGRRAEWTLEVAAGTPAMRVNPRHLELILRNLLDNAAKFADAEPVRVAVRAFPQGGRVAIAVTDSGRGIPPEDLGRIFEKFYQVEKHFTGNVEGVGLGLALVKRLVGAYGGAVQVQSELGRGSTFTVTLPAMPPAVSQSGADQLYLRRGDG
jgi:signal transduction histidine kinase